METIKRLATATFTALWLFHGAAVAGDAEPAADTANAAPPVVSASQKAAADAFPAEQIEQMVAPIALYPDALLAQIFMAATYPLDIVQADRWLEDHGDLEGEALQTAADAEGWDPSVQALVFFPQILAYMSDNLNWTQDLGDAVLAQEPDVTAAVQRLRKEAEVAGTLTSTEQLKVESKGDTIIVQPADPEVVYVPSYSPATAYGPSEPPTTSYYPATYDTPVYAPEVASTVVPVGTVATDTSTTDSLLTFGAGALVGGLLTAAIMWDDNDRGIWYGGRGYYGRPGYWGGNNYWNDGWRNGNAIQRNINSNRNVDRSRNIQTGDINVNRGISGNTINAGKWEHNAANRGGVRYRNKETRAKYDNTRRAGNIDRDQARGRNPDRTRPGGGDRKPGDIGRPGRGDGKPGGIGRPGGADGKPASRPGGGDRKPADLKGKDKVGDRKRSGAGANKPATKKAATRPAKVNKPQAKRPATQQAKRPATQQAKRPASTRQAKSSAFKPQAGRADRAASSRGAASRAGSGARANRGGGAAKASRGGGRAAGGGGRGGGGRGGGGGGRR